jgi:hypothetical protein
MKTKRTAKRAKVLSGVSDNLISLRSRKMLDHSAATLKKGLASAPIETPTKRRRLGALKGRMEIRGDIIHSDMEDDWQVQ